MEHSSTLFELATAYHTCPDLDSLLKALAAHLGARLGARSVQVWSLTESGDALTCRARWTEAGAGFEPTPEPVTEGILAEMLEATRARRLGGKEIDRDALVHLDENDRERVKSAVYAPLLAATGTVGVVEVLNKRSGEFSGDDAVLLEEALRLTGPALEARRVLEKEKQANLATIDRLTALYDIGRVFNSTLELTELLPVVADKIRDILGAQACNLWLVDAEKNDLYFAQQVGDDPTTDVDDRCPLGEGLLGQVAQQGQPRLIADVQGEAELLAFRQQRSPEFPLATLMAAPLLKEEEIIGVVEVVNKQDGGAYDEDDLFFLTSISEMASIALNNANRLAAERKVRELDALLAISKEITSTLDLDHILTTVVHQAATVLPFDRCAIGLFDRNRFILGAVSGEAEVPKTREMDQLRELMEWVATQADPVSADNYDEGWKVSPEEGHPRLRGFLDAHGHNGFYAVPLRDDQGTVAVLALLSGDAEFLSENHLEVLSILASQATVAIRNARLYQEVPLVSFWQPLMEKKQKLMAIPYARWLEGGWKVGLAALVLLLVQWPMRIGATATVVPAERRAVSAEVEGVIKRILVREGDRVEAGAVLAELQSGDDRVRLERALASLAQARSQLAEAEGRRDLGAATQARLEMQMHEAEVALYRERVEKASLRSSIAGIVVTPKVEEKVGQLLEPGDTFCELVNNEKMAAELNVPEAQVDLVQPGSRVALKLNTFPTHTFEGAVERVGAQTISAEAQQFFVVRAVFSNPEGRARAGMAGQGKISAAGGWPIGGWYPVGYVVLRSPMRWAWRKAWTWLP